MTKEWTMKDPETIADKNANQKIPYVAIPVSTKTSKNNQSIGRARFKIKLKSSISEAMNGKGASFLVGGYRGIGKTHLVDNVSNSYAEAINSGVKLNRENITNLHKLKLKLKKIYHHVSRLWPVKLRLSSLKGSATFDTNKEVGTRSSQALIINCHILKLDIGVDSDLSTRDILCDITELMYSISLAGYRRFKIFLFILFLGSTLLYELFISEYFAFQPLFKAVDSESNNKAFNIDWLIVRYLIATALLYWIGKFFYKHIATHHGLLEELTFASRFSREWDNSNGVAIPQTRVPLFQNRKKFTQEPISARRIQEQLQQYINKQRAGGQGYIIILDEVDKINPSPTESYATNTKSRKQKVDELLGGLKALMSNSRCVFIVVAGREIVDAYYSESGYTSVLYESVFDDIFYIPTLLTDWSDGQFEHYTSMVRQYINTVVFDSDSADIIGFLKSKKADINNLEENTIVDTLFYFEIFVKYLTLHSWGNFKRLKLMLNDHFEYYTENLKTRIDGNNNAFVFTAGEAKNQKILLFTPSDIRRMFVSARLYALYESNIGRITSKTDDKAAVSGLITILDTFRFHSRGFSRSMIDRTIAGIDVHAESTLSYIADDYVHSTFQSMIRRTSNNIYPYRYYLSTDMEFSFFAKILGAKSSSFEFALDSSEPVREFYLREAKRQSPDGSVNSFLASAKLQAILGDIFVSEHRYDLASSSYSNTVFLLKKVLRTENEEAWRGSGGISLEAQYMLIRNLLKKGRLEEERENTNKALALYHEAKKTAQILFEVSDKDGKQTSNKLVHDDFSNFDRKNDTHHFLKESLIAKFAADFAYIKGGNFTRLENYESNYLIGENIDDSNEDVGRFLSKYLSVVYFSGFYTTFVNNQSNGYEKIISTIENLRREFSQGSGDKTVTSASSVLYIWGQCQFSLLASNLKLLAKESIKRPSKLRFYRQWLLLVDVMFGCDYKLSKLRDPAVDCQIHKRQEYLTLLPYEKQNIDLLVDSFVNIFTAADKSKKSGRYAEAAHQYTAILLNWISLLEILPWQKFKSVLPAKASSSQISTDEKTLTDILKKIGTKVGKKPVWLGDVIECAQDCVEKADKSSNVALRERVLSSYNDCNVDSANYCSWGSLRVADILKKVESEEKGRVFPTLIWCRSNLSNYLLVFGLWENYCRYSFSLWSNNFSENKVIFNFKEIPMPIGNLPRFQGIYNWIGARYQMHELKKEIEKSTTTQQVQKDSIIKFADIIEKLSSTLDDYKKAFRSDDPDSFPSKTHVFYNLAEIIKYIETNYEESSKEVISKIVKELKIRKQNKVSPFLSESNRGIFLEEDTIQCMYLDKNYIDLHLNKYRFDLLEIDNISSLSYKRKLRHKYFLYDDFDDPFYIAEWAYLRMMSSTCRLLTV